MLLVLLLLTSTSCFLLSFLLQTVPACTRDPKLVLLLGWCLGGREAAATAAGNRVVRSGTPCDGATPSPRGIRGPCIGDEWRNKRSRASPLPFKLVAQVTDEQQLAAIIDKKMGSSRVAGAKMGWFLRETPLHSPLGGGAAPI